MAKLYFYYSAMNAGKTTTLLQSNYNYKERGMETLLFTPALDDRKSKGVIASRIGLEAGAHAFEVDFDFLAFVRDKKKNMNRLACVLIDEAQFLSKNQVRQLCDITHELGVPVLCYGLRTDFLAEPFEGSLYLLAWAEELVEIKTICHCGRKATMNLRIDAQGLAVQEGESVEIGGNERYVALCRAHYYDALQGGRVQQPLAA
jgi:thymidine kinase